MNIERRLISFGIFALPLSPLPPVLDVYGSKELFGQSTKDMRAQLRSRNKLVEGMQESLWYMLLDALEQRHLFGHATKCCLHRGPTYLFHTRIQVCFQKSSLLGSRTCLLLRFRVGLLAFKLAGWDRRLESGVRVSQKASSKWRSRPSIRGRMGMLVHLFSMSVAFISSRHICRLLSP